MANVLALGPVPACVFENVIRGAYSESRKDDIPPRAQENHIILILTKNIMIIFLFGWISSLLVHNENYIKK